MDDVAWGKLIEDLNRIAEGKDANGDALYTNPNGDDWGGTFLFAEGDLQQLCEGWGLRHYNSPTELCGFCLANRDRHSYPYTDVTRHAPWRPTEVTNEVAFENVRAINGVLDYVFSEGSQKTFKTDKD